MGSLEAAGVGEAVRMSWQTSEAVADFLDQAGPFLRSRPVENTVLLTLAETLKSQGPQAIGEGDPIFGWWTAPGDRVEAAFLQTPPFPVLVSAAPADAIGALPGALDGRSFPGFNALEADADALAEKWESRTGRAATPGHRSRLFRLDRLTPPTPAPPGKARVAGHADRALLIDWLHVFHEEIGSPGRDVGKMVDDKLAHSGLLLWETDGHPVSLAGQTRPQSGMVRVIAVYTPREHRARGYAGAVTTAVTQAALDAGATDVVLFTDLSNPTSNALYQRLGYRPVEDRKVVEFG